MQTSKNPRVIFFLRLLIVLIFYQLVRFGFFLYNDSFFSEFTFKTLKGGLIFDLSVLGYINIIFAVLYFIPFKFQENKNYQRFLFYSFFIVNAFFISLNFVDYQYFRFVGRRSSFGMITAEGMHNEIGGLIISYLIDYWQVPLIGILFNAGLWFSLYKLTFHPVRSLNKVQSIISILLFAGILFLFGRGAGKKPLGIVDATTYAEEGNTALVLNTPFTVFKTLSNKNDLKEVNFYDNEEQLNQIFNPIQTFHSDIQNKKNVVILILESFGNENINRGQTPFLDSLITKSLYFKNAFSNGKLSIDAVPSTMSSIPSLMNRSIISSSYSLNEIYGLPKILKANGYETSFFHGAFNGSQNFDQYAKVVGFDRYYGKNEYKGPEAFDGKWGIFDEEFLQFFAKELNTFEQPFFSSLFTISSHAPFIIPDKYADKFPKGTTEIHETIAYTDYALKKFFETVEKMPWYKNTIFIITADHTSSSGEEPIYRNNVGKFRIPILFFNPNDQEMQGVVEKNFQQVDILPSIVDYLGLNEELITYGKSYKSDQDFVVNYLDNIYNLEVGDYYLSFNGTEVLGLYNWKTDPLLVHNLKDTQPIIRQKMEQFLKAYIQSFNHRVINNKLVLRNK